MILDLLLVVVRVVVGLGLIVISNLVIVLFVGWRVLPVCPSILSLRAFAPARLDFSSFRSYCLALLDSS
jgi:hypothetical protein